MKVRLTRWDELWSVIGDNFFTKEAEIYGDFVGFYAFQIKLLWQGLEIFGPLFNSASGHTELKK